MPDFSHRATGVEVMDDLDISGSDLHQALRELESINYLLGGNYVTLDGVSQLLEKAHSTPLHIADLGCGSGDMLRMVRKLLDKREIDATLTGFDANRNVIAFAEAHTPAACRIQYESLDILSDEFKGKKFDIVVGTLFFHHFSSEDLKGFFKQLKQQVKVGVIINDIHRHWFSFYSIKWLTKFFSRSRMVKHDAPLSVLRSFRKKELVEIVTDAGFVDYRIKWRWAFRWQAILKC
jgi:2-polyprenyl-3-methyl-5-hydroxy-6-metoxy-1,4-benzoquinol methylase